MERLHSENTINNFKDTFNNGRNSMITELTKKYNNPMNNLKQPLNNNKPQLNNNENYNFSSNPLDLNIREPLSYTSISGNIKIKDLSETDNYSNFIPFPKDTRNIIPENTNNIKQEIYNKDIEKIKHPKQIYIDNIDKNNELLQNQKTIRKMEPVNINTLNNTEFNNSYNNLNSNYTAEIGDKRKLSNVIYNSIIKTYKNNYNTLIESEVNNIINRINIVDNKWTKGNTIDFVKQLQNIKDNNTKTEMKVIKEDPYIISQGNDDLFEKETKEIEYYITIDSNDRYKKTYPNSNEYQINLGNNNSEEQNTGFINTNFQNVTSVELIEAIIPSKSYNGTEYNTLPYILLEIEELGNVYQGTNDCISKTFSQLIFDKIVGNYRYCTFSEQTRIKKKFNPRIALNKLTIRFKKPNGDLYNFGDNSVLNNNNDKENNNEENQKTENNNEENQKTKNNNEENQKTKNNNENIFEPNNILTFKITCIQKSLDTMFLNH
jgi:hypothetical protein